MTAPVGDGMAHAATARAARAAAVVALSGLVACGSSGSRHQAGTGMRVTSPAFNAGDPIPVRYTCLGDNVSPPLGWSGVPSAAVELAVVVDDPDAPNGTFVHWVLAGLPPTRTVLAAGERPPGAVEARGSSGEVGYTGPCPPNHQTHHYRFTVYALRARSGVTAGASSSTALPAITTNALATGTLVARFGR